MTEAWVVGAIGFAFFAGALVTIWRSDVKARRERVGGVR